MAKKLTGEGVQHEGRFWTIVRRALVILMLTLASCGGSDTSDTPDSSLACDHFWNVIADINDGILTDEEVRQKLKEVRDNAAIASSEVQESATELLASMTGPMDRQKIRSASQNMSEACISEGYEG